jgi:hypothetical protein
MIKKTISNTRTYKNTENYMCDETIETNVYIFGLKVFTSLVIKVENVSIQTPTIVKEVANVTEPVYTNV